MGDLEVSACSGPGHCGHLGNESVDMKKRTHLKKGQQVDNSLTKIMKYRNLGILAIL